jgi:biopolymer transport protein ExbD
MRRVLFVLIALATFTIGTGFVSGLQLLDAAFPLYPPSVPPVQLKSSKVSEPLDHLDHLWCGDLVVMLEPDGRLTLGSSSVGTVDDTKALTLRLMEIFRERRETRAQAQGLECRTDLSTEDFIPKRVFIKAPGSTKFSDVARVFDAVRDTGAYPIGFVVERKSGGFSDTSN